MNILILSVFLIMKFTLVLLTLNEIQGCKMIIPRIDKSLFSQLLVIDGGSQDGTIEYLKSHGFEVVKQEKKYSFFKKYFFRQKIVDAYRYGLEYCKNEYVVIPFTPDNNMIPEKLSELIKKIKEGYDLVCVSRYKDNAKSFDDNMLTSFGNKLFTSLVNFFFEGNFTDVLGGYKCIKKELFNKMGINKNNMRISVQTQLAIGCVRNNIKYCDIPGDEPKRIYGKSSVKPIIHGLWELIVIFEAYLKKNLYKFKK